MGATSSTFTNNTTRPIDLVLDRLDHVKGRNGQWTARCPNHDDRCNSLSIGLGDDDRVLLKCHAGCPPEAIARKLGLAMADLFPAKPNPGEPAISTAYDYRDETGALLCQAVRKQFADHKTFYQRRPKPGGGWIYNLDGVRRVLYRLPELRAAIEAGEYVIVVEGEKDADRLVALGHNATTSIGGAGKWRGEYAETLRGASCILIPDNDIAGYQHMLQVARSLAGKAAELVIIRLTDVAEKGDISDFLSAGARPDNLNRLFYQEPHRILGAGQIDLATLAVLAGETTAGGNGRTDDAGQSTPNPPRAETAPTGDVTCFPWPVLADEAMHGLAGEIARAGDAHAEADKAAVLVTVLEMFGNAVGRSPYVAVGESRHHANDFAAIVGDTSKARKGESRAWPRRVFRLADDKWYLRCKGGLNSGEGLIWQIHDEVRKYNHKTGEEEIVEPNIEDKRLFLEEDELSLILKVIARQGNTLSETVRRAWDSPLTLESLTKNAPGKATNSHISIVAHITEAELKRTLTETESANGFGNRFAWFCAKRSKAIPDPQPLPDQTASELAGRLRTALDFGRQQTRLKRDAEAAEQWAAIYPDLSSAKPGLAGALIARAEAHVTRWSLRYALLDKATEIRTEHLMAALALWDYAEASAFYIFGDATGDPIADRILTALRQGGAMTRNAIMDFFGRNVRAAALDHALETLLAAGKVTRNTDTDTGGRPADVWAPV